MILFLVSLLALQGVFSSPLSRSISAPPKSSSEDYLLPTNIRPNHYTIELEPNFETDTFTGSVTIDFTVVTATRNIVFHKRELEIASDSISVSWSTISGFSCVQDDKEFCTVTVSDEFVEGQQHSLTIGSFTGILNLDNAGFYLAKYEDEDGNEVKMATTQFESTSARRAFPCLDEPALKATYTLKIIRSANYHTIANTKATTVGDDLGEGRYRDTFEINVPMSTYLLAFIVSQFDHTETQERHTVYARPTEISKGAYALETGQKTLQAIESFLDVDYSLEKMDQAAIPNNYFAAGAMENWGLVTYREAYLLYSSETSLTSQKQSIATVIAHEFGHQWFGNLVSPQWWSYIWLNEGFATYFEFYAASIAEPDWELMDQFVVRNLQYAFGPDSLSTTRAMNTDAGSPSDVSALFDRVAYEKSGSVIRMFESFLTTPVFRAGLKKYLTNKQYDAATPSDLYTALQEAVEESETTGLLPNDLSVSDVLSTWDSIAGYPVVKVERNYDNGEVKFSQSRFLLKSSQVDTSSLWYIPINYATPSSNDFSDISTDFWLTTADATVTFDDLGADDWLIVNKQERGYYRVNYDEDNWRLIIDYLNTADYSKISRLNRAQLIDDSFHLARSGRLNYQYPLELALYLKRETDYIPLFSFFQSLIFVDSRMAASEEYDTFKQYVLGLLENAYTKLGTSESDDDSHLDKLNRINVLTWLCKYGHEECREAAHEQLHIWKNTGAIITPNLQSVYFCGASATADQEHWDFLYEQLETQTESTLRTRIINGLGCSEDTTILEGYLNKIIDADNTVLSSSEKLTAFLSVINAGNTGLATGISYLKENEEVKDSLNVASIVSTIGSRVTTDDQLSELKEIVQKYGLDEALLTTAEENVEWVSSNLNTFEMWFVKYRSSAPTLSVTLFTFVAAAAAILYF